MPKKKMDDLPKVNKGNTKVEIYDAYQELMKQLEDVEVDAPVEEEERTHERKQLEKKHKATTVDQVLKQLTDLKLGVNKAITEVTEGLVDRSEQLNELVKTIELEENYLKDVEQIKVQVKSLKQLLRMQEQQKREFEKEMESKRQAWEEEQKQKERQRKLEDDEYSYELQRNRRSQEEEYEKHKNARTQELKNRETILKEAEDELKDLRAKAEKFPAELEKAVAVAAKAERAETEREAKTQLDLITKQTEGEQKLAETQIASLKETVKTQTERIANLEHQLGQANDRIKEIAAGAVGFGKGRGEEKEARKDN
jgi:DNA repair exonuclease SbcCD ATPase subunit